MYKNLKELMEEKKVTAAELSRATGISQALISMWKKREGGMSAENAIKLANYFEVPVERIVGM